MGWRRCLDDAPVMGRTAFIDMMARRTRVVRIMKRDLLNLLACPACREGLTLAVDVQHDEEIESGRLSCARCRRDYPIDGAIPRFVSGDNYASSFGYQWNAFRRTQLDSCSGVAISRQRLLASTGWPPETLRGRRVLDAGCGAGRFSEIALSAGARVVAVDYSSAVDACRENLYPNPNLDVVQADLYHLPFAEGSFEDVYCLGVLQHTPDVKAAFMAVTAQVQKQGRVAVDVYPRLTRNLLWPKYWLRPIMKRLPPALLFAIVERAVPWLLPVSDALSRVPLIGTQLRYAVPVANIGLAFPELSAEQAREWAVLDTFDMFSPRYDRPQSAATLREWCTESGLAEVAIFRRGHLIARGTR